MNYILANNKQFNHSKKIDGKQIMNYYSLRSMNASCVFSQNFMLELWIFKLHIFKLHRMTILLSSDTTSGTPTSFFYYMVWRSTLEEKKEGATLLKVLQIKSPSKFGMALAGATPDTLPRGVVGLAGATFLSEVILGSFTGQV